MGAAQILFYHENGQIRVHFSQGLTELLGYDDSLLEEATITFKDLMHPHDYDVYESLFNPQITSQTLSVHGRMRHSHGKIVCVLGQVDRTYDVLNQRFCIDLSLQNVKTLPRTMEDAASIVAFKTMMETTDDFIFFKDRNHVFTGASATLAAMFGTVEHWSDLVGLIDYDVFQESEADVYYRLEKELFRSGKSVREKQSYTTKDGENGWVDNRKYPIKDANGFIIGLYGVARDITQTHLLEEQLRQKQETLLETENRFRSIFDQIENIAVQGYDENRNVIYWNNASEQIYGYAAEEVMGKDFTQLIVPPPIRSFVVSAHSNWVHNDIPIPASELELLTKEGSSVSVYSSHVMLSGLDGKKEMYCIDLDLSDMKKTSNALQENQQLLRTVIDEMPSVLVVKDAKGNFVLGNKTVADLYGTTPEQMIGKHDDDFGVPKEIADGFRASVLAIMEKGETQIVVEESRDAITGAICHFKSIKKPFIDNNGNQQILVIATDITEILEAQKKVIESEHVLQEIMEIAHEGIWDWHIPSGKIVHNQQWYEILKIKPDAHTNTLEEFESIVHPDDIAFVKEHINALLSGRTLVYYSEHRMICSDGSVIWVQDRGDVIERDERGNPVRLVGAFTDITYQKKHQNELEYMAHYDMLTGLPNRSLEADRLKQAMAQVKRTGGYIAVIYLDLDGFKEINDSYGHDAGDFVLISVAKNMSQTLRDEDTISRLGGDEFAIIIPNLKSKEEALEIVERLLDQAAKLIMIEEHRIALSASAGVTFYPQTEDIDGDQLIRQADLAMYQAKQAGQNRYHIFDTENDRVTRRYHETFYNIEKAFHKDEFILHYQPKINMRTREIIGAEALIRWNHPQRGLLYPMEFLPMIENSALASKIGAWVIDTALHQIATWTTLGYTIPISVNVGATQLLKSDFVEQVKHLLNKHVSVDPKMLEIEILETSALEDMQAASKIIAECSKLKIHFSLDDFGTGYSSLSYLKRLPVTTLKIDQSFIRDLLHDPDDRLIVMGIIGLAKAFAKNLVAEGVESKEIATELVALGCDFGQGYGISRPISSDDFLVWLREWNQV